MNTNTMIIGAIVVVLAIAGIIYYTEQNMTPVIAVATSTTTVQGNNTTPAASAAEPDAVTNSVATPTGTTAIVAGTVTPNGAFTSYWYEYGTTANFGSKTSAQNIGSGYNAIPAPAYITGLANDTTYDFRIVAQNQFGTVNGTQYAFHTTESVPNPVGSAPVAKTTAASGITRTAANLNGSVNPEKATTEYWFEYGTSANLGQTGALVSVGSGSNNIPAALPLSNLAPATTYYYRLNAENQFGTVNGSILTFKTAGPATSEPSATTGGVSGIGSANATLSGTVNPGGLATTYWFEYSTDSLLGSVLLSSTAQVSAGAGTDPVPVTADISNLESGTNYYFRLVAQNSAGTVRGNRAAFKTN